MINELFLLKVLNTNDYIYRTTRVQAIYMKRKRQESINDNQLIEVSVDKIVDGIVFPFKIKEQKVELKRFSD